MDQLQLWNVRGFFDNKTFYFKRLVEFNTVKGTCFLHSSTKCADAAILSFSIVERFAVSVGYSSLYPLPISYKLHVTSNQLKLVLYRKNMVWHGK